MLAYCSAYKRRILQEENTKQSCEEARCRREGCAQGGAQGTQLQSGEAVVVCDSGTLARCSAPQQEKNEKQLRKEARCGWEGCAEGGVQGAQLQSGESAVACGSGMLTYCRAYRCTVLRRTAVH